MSLHSNMYTALLLLLCVSLLSLGGNATDNPNPETTDLGAIYDVNQHASVKGGCLVYMDRLRTSYAEALHLVDVAIQALDDLENSRPPKPPQGDIAIYNEWVRKAQVFLAMFGEKIPEDGTLGAAGTTVRGTSTASDLSVMTLISGSQLHMV